MANNEKLLEYLAQGTENRSFGPDTPVYAPQRDITTLYPVAVNEIWEDLVTENNSRYYAMAKVWGFSPDQMMEAFNLYVDTLTHFQHGVAATFDEAASLTGFSELDPRIILCIEALVGRYMAAAWFYGIKDITVQNEEPPVFSGYDTLQMLLEEISNGLDGIETPLARRIKQERAKEEPCQK